MTKTERWYALVEELRAASPRPRSARWLAERFEVSSRTVERDLAGLLAAGVPIYAESGRTGGYVLDRTATFSAPALDTAEVTALALAVSRLAGTPFAEAGRSALTRLVGALPRAGRAELDAAAARIGLLGAESDTVPQVVQRAVRTHRVLRLDYEDADGVSTSRDVEPLGLLGGQHWYFVGWCRLRDGVRGFRLDRVRAVTVLQERAPERGVDITTTAPGHTVRALRALEA